MEINTENLITITPRITLNPPVLQDIEVTENGEYKADGSADGLGTVTVNVNPPLEEITITENGEYLPSKDFYGIGKIVVNVISQEHSNMSHSDIESIVDEIWQDDESLESQQEIIPENPEVTDVINELWGGN